MRCPSCAHSDNKVIDSRLARDEAEVRRRRECLECGRRFTTRERLEEAMPRIVKRDERREDYTRSKLLTGVELACRKRPVSANTVERLLERLEKRLQEQGEREVTSGFLGEAVLSELQQVDPVSAARFASVFRDFQGPDDYAKFFASLPRELRAVRRSG